MGKFMDALGGLAIATGADVSEDELALFDALVLQPHGEAQARSALVRFILDEGFKFPTRVQLLERINGRAIASAEGIIENFMRWRAQHPRRTAAA